MFSLVLQNIQISDICFPHALLFVEAVERKLACKVLEICLSVENDTTSTASFKQIFVISGGS